jgi:hypothetical protein
MTTRLISAATARKLRKLGGSALRAGYVAGLMFIVGFTASESTTGMQGEEQAASSRPAITLRKAVEGTKSDRFLADRMPIGFYIYLYNWKQNTDPAATDLDEALTEMAGRGFNLLYVGGVSDTPVWKRLLEQCIKHHIAVIPQLEFAYLRNPNDDVAALAAKAVQFIRKYKDHPAVIAFSVREEPREALMPALKRYFKSIQQEVPDVRLHLLFDTLGPLKKLEEPFPQIIGTDRYPFWWEFGSGGHRATPSYALNWFRRQMDAYYRETQARGVEFQATFTADTLEYLGTEDQVRKSFYPAMSESQRGKYLRSFKENARKKNLGLAEAHDGLYQWWKYYRPPANCTSAMAWLSVLEGARSILVWSWAPLPKDMKDFAHHIGGKAGHEYISSITGWRGNGTPQLEEFTATARELQHFAGLIRVMTREAATAGEPEKPVMGTSAENLFLQSFAVPGYRGKAVVVVNTAVGSWCEGRSPSNISPTSLYRIDDEGNALDYTPFTAAREVAARVLSDTLECVDLKTGKTVPIDANGVIKISIRPGGGRFFFVHPKGGKEWPRFKQEFRL